MYVYGCVHVGKERDFVKEVETLSARLLREGSGRAPLLMFARCVIYLTGFLL